MRKFLLVFLAVLSAVVLTCSLVACVGDETPEYNVTFNLNYDNSPAVTVLKTKDGEVQYIDNPTRVGFEFVEWCTDAEGAQSFSDGKITADITLYAKWQAVKATYTVTYTVNGEVYQTAQVKDGESVTLLSYEASAGQRFAGWTLDGQQYFAGGVFTVNSNVTFNASLIQLHAITFISGGQTVKTIYIAKGEQVTLPTAQELSIEGNFLGWTTSPSSANVYYGGYVFTLDTSDDIVFYARFDGEHTLSFSLGYDAEDTAVLPADAVYVNGASVKLPAAVTRDGYRFDGWYDGNKLHEGEANYTMPASDVTLTAQWVKVYVVTFYYNYEGSDGAYLSKTVDENSRVSQPENPSRAEHKFVNWYSDADLSATFRFTNRINEDTAIYAGWAHNYFAFTPTPDGQGYYVSHASSPDFTGIAQGTNLVLPKTYNGKPVVSLLPVACGNNGYGHLIGSMGPLWRLFAINSSFNSPFISVTIPNTWTEIPDNAFGLCDDTLFNVYFEEGANITRIGNFAFYQCKSLQSLDIPATVTELGEGAFNSCESLASIDMSACTIAEIPFAAFRNCHGLRSIQFPQGLTKIGDSAFNSAFLYTSGDMPYHNDSEMNELLNARLSYDTGTTFADIVIPEGVTYIGMWAFANETGINDAENDPADSAYDELQVNYSRWGYSYVTYFNFYYSHLRSVKIPSTVEYLGRGAFAWCENLESVEFAEGFKDDTLRDYMFYATALNNAVFPEGIKNIEKAVFMHCDNIKTVSIPSTVKYIGRRAFAYTSSLETVTFAQGINLKLYYIGEYANGNMVLVDSGALFDHSGIKNIDIPASVELLPQYMFQSCKRLTTVTFEEGSVLKNIRAGAFMNSGLESINLPETLETIGAQAFNNTQLKQIYLPASLSNGDLSTGTAGGDENKLGWYAFADNSKLEKIVFAPDCQLEVLSFRVFANCPSLTEVILSNNLRSVNGTYAKTAYDNPATPDVVEGTIWTSGAFIGCTALERITVPEGNPYIKAVGYALYSRTTVDGEYINLDWYSQAQAAGGEVTIEDGIVNIYEYVFSENKFITKLNFPASIKVIGIAACRSMTSLEEVIFAPNSQLEEIGNYAFGNITTYPTITSDTGFESTNYNAPPIKTPFVKIVFTSLTAPKLGANIFVWSSENPDFTIIVPEEAIDAYKTAFAQYASYVKATEE